jgi:hypothetical protein
VDIIFYIHSLNTLNKHIIVLGCIITEAELQEIQVEVEDVENNCVPQDRFVEYMRKAISEQKYVLNNIKCTINI